MPYRLKLAARSAMPTSFQKDDIGTQKHSQISQVTNDLLRTPNPLSKPTGKGPERSIFSSPPAKIVYDFSFWQGILDPFKGRIKNA
jgi:hypothetical protein